jgi:hypothetical protein
VGFPDERDLSLQRQAEAAENLATELAHWLGTFNDQRRQRDLGPISEADEFELTRLRRQAANLYSSTRVPVAAAVFGPSQVGKSLFVGRVLAPTSEDFSPLGRDEQNGEPGYFQRLSFDADLNPQSGSNEATALVTRFTTKDRITANTPREFPVMVRALTRSQWLRVLARGFSIECATPEHDLSPAELESQFEELSGRYAADQVDHEWRMDLLDAYSYMRSCDPRGFKSDEPVVNGLLSRYPLREEGYVALAAYLFWNNWRTLTVMFLRINEFLGKIRGSGDGRDPAILLHWAAVRFLLDSQRAKVHERRSSRCFKRVDWADFRMMQRNGQHVLDYHPGQGGGNEPLETIQAAMLELIVPILPHRLSEDWRRVIEHIDILDIPGLRAGRQGGEQGKRTSADTLEEQMEIVKRGKVAYLFDRYTDDLQIQTLLLLARGGNLEVTAQMRASLDRWGRTRYGEDVWPLRVRDALPALFVGLTGIDEEFRTRGEYADPMLYETRLSQLSDALGPVVNDFGGRGRSFDNVYPLRYPGTWDADEKQRQREGPDKWEKAQEAFLRSSMVERYVASAAQRWAAAMSDADGGLSLISAGWREVTSATQKQDHLAARIHEISARLLQMGRSWVVNPNANFERAQRAECATKVIDWLMADRQGVYERVQALRRTLCFREGELWALADFADMPMRNGIDRPDALEMRLPDRVRDFLHEWASLAVPRKWEQTIAARSAYGPWLPLEDVCRLGRYLRDYFCTSDMFGEINARLTQVVGLKLRDEAAQRYARRKYVRLLMNDLVLSPGLADLGQNVEVDEADWQQFGLMGSFIARWRARLPEALAAGAGSEVRIPPGNSELIQLLAPYEGT